MDELSNLRNATQRDPSFKNWRQATLTVMQRIWPGDQARSERFRRIPFSPADPRADGRAVREWYSRGCQEAGRVLNAFIEEIRRDGVPETAGAGEVAATANEFEDGFPTVDLPLGTLKSRLGEIDKWKEHPVLLHCATGNRSQGAAATLKAAGFKEVFNLRGGLGAWQQAGMPVEKK